MRSALAAVNSGVHIADFSYESPANPCPIVPVPFAATLSNACVTGPDGVGCELVPDCTLTGLAEIICDLLQPKKTLDIENAAIPLSS